ncbi:MAG: LytTR family transcriptional regulator [Muribaculaceae bacterium]|nr:LytTR family transcriptional regulator [Muribaculaceae bacterium]
MEKYLLFATSSELVRIPASAMVCVTADGNYSTITTADGSDYTLTLQLGQVERRIAECLCDGDGRFIRIGKSLIINREFIIHLNIGRQRIVLSDCRSFRRDVSASKEALKALRELIEKEAI